MKKSILLFTTVLVLLLSVAALAQKEEGKWRNFEFSAFGALSVPTGALKNWNDSMGAKTGFELGGTGGYYLNEKVCLGVYFTYNQFPMKLYTLHYKLYEVGGYFKYTFIGESNFEPYVKVTAGADFAKFPTWVGEDKTRLREISYKPGFAAGIGAGLLWYSSDFGGLFLEAGYHFAPLKSVKADYQDVSYPLGKNVGYMDIRFGVNVFFGPEK